MPEKPQTAKCLQCDRSADEIPLLSIAYQGETLWICPQHLPLLIHHPARLVGKLPGAESFTPASHVD